MRGRITFIADFQTVPQGRDSLFFRMIDPVAIRSGYAAVVPSVTAYAIGWIGDAVASLGDTPDVCISTLLNAYEAHHIFSDETLGSHSCEVCPPTLPQRGYYHPFAWKGRQAKLYGHGHYLVRYGRSLFVSPALILHYIVDHQYRPPEAFIEAVVSGRILTKGDCEFIPDDETRWERLRRYMRRWLPLSAQGAPA
ncbi:MAG TPA: hypothetical protein VH438_13940 [Gemmatimonadales bacterium]|jgi:hypothetical protein